MNDKTNTSETTDNRQEANTMHRVKTRITEDGQIVHVPVPTVGERLSTVHTDSVHAVKVAGSGTVKGVKATGRGIAKASKFLGRGLARFGTQTVHAPKEAATALVRTGQTVRDRREGKKYLYERAAREAAALKKSEEVS